METSPSLDMKAMSKMGLVFEGYPPPAVPCQPVANARIEICCKSLRVTERGKPSVYKKCRQAALVLGSGVSAGTAASYLLSGSDVPLLGVALRWLYPVTNPSWVSFSSLLFNPAAIFKLQFGIATIGYLGAPVVLSLVIILVSGYFLRHKRKQEEKKLGECLANSEREKRELEGKLDALHRQVDSLRQREVELGESFATSQQEKINLQGQVDFLQGQVESLREREEKLQECLVTSKQEYELQGQLEVVQGQVDSLQEQIARLMEEKEVLRNRADDLREENNLVMEENAFLVNRMNGFQEQNNRVVEEKEVYKNRVEDLREENNMVMEENKYLMNRVNDLQEQSNRAIQEKRFY